MTNYNNLKIINQKRSVPTENPFKSVIQTKEGYCEESKTKEMETPTLRFKKCKEHPDNILFIDASKHFEKVKTQNILRDEDVDRIVSTYIDRKTIDNYAYVATIAEVKENDWNLNIPRYVDTFEEEEPVDLDSVAKQLISLNESMEGIDNAIKEYCSELKIGLPI